MRFPLFAAALFPGILLYSHQGGATGSPRALLAVSGDARANCISAQALEERVEADMGSDIFTRDSPALVIRIVWTSLEGRWGAEIRAETLAGARYGTRRLAERSANCRELDDALVLVLGLILDEMLELPPPLKQETTSESAPPAKTETRRTEAVVLHAPERSGVSRTESAKAAGSGEWLIGAEGRVSARILPRLAPGVVLSVGHQWNSTLRTGVSAELMLPQEISTSSRDSVEFDGARALLFTCVQLGDTLRIGPCLGALLTTVRAQGQGFEQNYAQRAWLWGGQGELRAVFPHGRRMRLTLAAAIGVNTESRTFSISSASGSTVAAVAHAIVPSGGLGVEFGLW